MAQSEQNKSDQYHQPKWVPLASRLLQSTGLITLCIALLLGLAKVLIIFSHRLDTRLSDPVQFVTGNLLNALIFIAIVAQVFIYRKQWQVMDSAAQQSRESFEMSHRAYVGVHSITLDTAAKLVLVKIENVGDLPADQVTVFLKLASIHDDMENFENQRIKTVSARQEYGRYKLVKGNLPILLTFRLQSKWSDKEIRLMGEGGIGLMLNGYVSYADGFSREPNQRTDFFFDYQDEIDCWTHNVADYGDILGYDEENDERD